MKKLFVLLMVLSTSVFYAQNFSEGSSAVNVGIGFASYVGTGTGYSTTIPPIEGQYEYFVTDQISVGGFFGYTAAEYRAVDWTGNDKYKYSYMIFGALGNYHFYDNDKFDAYGGLKLGYNNVSSKYTGVDQSGVYLSETSSSGMLFGAQIGGRYFFTENIAGHLELGYGISAVKVGVTFKL